MQAPAQHLDAYAHDRKDGSSRLGERYVPPPMRPLKVYAFDPMTVDPATGRNAADTITIDVKYEKDLKPGPAGNQVAVVDYDGGSGRIYAPVDLNNPAVLLRGGLEPAESDPRFHQQMVYAVAMKVIENFERALGRSITFRRGRPLRLFPHAFRGANAFYDPGLRAVLFGYFQADQADPGPNLPGQMVFTCLSQDIIAHEMTHALVDRLRPGFGMPTNRDVFAFHEGFADIVAILQHFSLHGILHDHIQNTRGDLRSPTRLVQLAEQFGYATGSDGALRSALDPGKTPDPGLYQAALEPHERGSILVAAVFDAFFAVYQRRIRDLIRIATGGTGALPPGDLHPDLVNRIAREAAKTAQSVLTMCIRAFEYLPPVDVTFGDFLRALVTADTELVTVDELGQRPATIEAFRRRGIYPDDVVSLAESSLLWTDRRGELEDLPVRDLMHRLTGWAEYVDLKTSGVAEADENWRGEMARVLHRYATTNAAKLDLDPQHRIRVRGFHSVFRVARDGGLLVELVAQFTQTAPSLSGIDPERLGGLSIRGGTTVIASSRGEVRYVISRPLPFEALSEEKRAVAVDRVHRLQQYVRECDADDPRIAWGNDHYLQRRMIERMNFARLHEGRRRRRGGGRR